MKTQTRSSVPSITPRVGEKFFRTKFGGKHLINALLELIKNGRNWHGTKIEIEIGKDYLQISDDGVGMDEENRTAFCSTAISTGNQHQTNKFGTGSKMMLFISNGVQVKTKTSQVEGVIEFSLDTETYQRMVLDQDEIIPEVSSASSWPLDSNTGTILRYDFGGPAKSHIKNVEQIAKELTEELPLVVNDAVLFNGKPLDKKQYNIKEAIREEVTDPELGMISIEIYKLKGGSKRSNKGITLSSTGFPEVQFHNFESLLDSKQRAVISDVYSVLSDVTGIITCRRLFDEYINEDRKSFNETIKESPLLIPFIKWLDKNAERVKNVLGLQEPKGDQNIEQLIGHLLERSASAFGPAYSQGENRNPGSGRETSAPRALTIQGGRHEYEPNQELTLTVVVNQNLCNTDKPLEWLHANSGLKDIKISKDKLSLTGKTTSDCGWKSISVCGVDNVGDEVSAQTNYTVVPTRRPYLSANVVNLVLGDDYKIFCFNSDLIKDKVTWRCEGKAGNLQVLGIEGKAGQAIFFANKPGVAKIYAEGKDTRGRQFRETCEITILDRKSQLFVLDGYKFEIFARAAVGNAPIVMKRGSGSGEDLKEIVHILTINSGHGVWTMKGVTSGLLPYWIIGEEYARFISQEINEEEPIKGRLDPRLLIVLGQNAITAERIARLLSDNK